MEWSGPHCFITRDDTEDEERNWAKIARAARVFRMIFTNDTFSFNLEHGTRSGATIDDALRLNVLKAADGGSYLFI
jgi:hypothetical protein